VEKGAVSGDADRRCLIGKGGTGSSLWLVHEPLQVKARVYFLPADAGTWRAPRSFSDIQARERSHMRSRFV
jgi:hypothetical protein